MNLSLFDFLYRYNEWSIWFEDFKSYLCLCLLYCSFISNLIHLDLVVATRIFFFFLNIFVKTLLAQWLCFITCFWWWKTLYNHFFSSKLLEVLCGEKNNINLWTNFHTRHMQKHVIKPREVQRLQSIWKIHVLQCVMSNISLTMIKYSCREGRWGELLKGKPVREPLILLYFFGWFVSTLPLELNLISLAIESIIKPLKLCSMLFLLTPTFSFSCKKQD